MDKKIIALTCIVYCTSILPSERPEDNEPGRGSPTSIITPGGVPMSKITAAEKLKQTLVGCAIEYIENGDLEHFNTLIQKNDFITLQSTSSKGHTLESIANHHNKPEFIQAIRQRTILPSSATPETLEKKSGFQDRITLHENYKNVGPAEIEQIAAAVQQELQKISIKPSAKSGKTKPATSFMSATASRSAMEGEQTPLDTRVYTSSSSISSGAPMSIGNPISTTSLVTTKRP